MDDALTQGLRSQRVGVSQTGAKGLAGLNEMAIGIATVLAGVDPDPLPVQLRGQSIDQAAYFVRAVVRECADAGISLQRVKLDDELFRWFTEPGADPLDCPLVGGGAPAEVLFFRQAAQ